MREVAAVEAVSFQKVRVALAVSVSVTYVQRLLCVQSQEKGCSESLLL